MITERIETDISNTSEINDNDCTTYLNRWWEYDQSSTQKEDLQPQMNYLYIKKQ